MRISRSTGAFSGVLIGLLAIWGGIVPFVGPYFHYAFGSTATWHFTTDRLWLDILPAAVALVGAFIMVRSGHRVSGTFGSWIAMAAGAWFVVGPAASRIWEQGAGPIGAPLYGPTRQAVELVGYFYGVGALIIALSAFALGRFVTRPGLVMERPAPVSEPTTETAEPTAAPGEPTPAPGEPTTTHHDGSRADGSVGDPSPAVEHSGDHTSTRV